MLWLTFVLVLFLVSLLLQWPVVFSFGIALESLLIILVLVNPRWALFFLLGLRMLTDSTGEVYSFSILESLSLSLSQVIGVMIFVAGVLYLIKEWRSLKELPLKSALLTYLLFSSITVFYSYDSFSTLKEILRLLDLIFLFLLSFNIAKDKDSLKKNMAVIVFISLVPALVSVAQYILGIGYTDDAFSTPRIFGTFSHPNSFSLYLVAVTSLLFLFYFLFLQNNKEKVVQKYSLLGMILLYVLLIVLSYTRVAWIALGIVIFILGILRFRKLLLLSGLFVLLVYLFSPSIQERVMETISFSPASSLSWRKDLWADSVNELFYQGRQSFGFGVNTFELVLEEKRGIKLGSTAAHNDFIRAFIEGGYIGLGVYLFYLGAILWYLFRRYRNEKEESAKIAFLVIFAMFASMSTASLTDNILRNTPLQWIFWISAGLVLGTFRSNKK